MSDNSEMEILTLKNISHLYDQEKNKIKILNNINITIKKGQMVSLIGPSGSGKSTLLNIAGLLEKPSIGSVFLLGKNIRNLNEDAKAILRGSNIAKRCLICNGMHDCERRKMLEERMMIRTRSRCVI